MPARSVKNQVNYIQKETTPGTPAVSAMKKLTAMRFSPGWAGASTPYMGGSSKVATSLLSVDEHGEWDVTGVQDFNNIGFPAQSRIAAPVITTPATGVNARQSVFSLNPDAVDTFASYTLQYGDATQALQSAYAVFNSLGIKIQRGALDMSTSIVSKSPTTGATLASAGLTTVPSVTIPPRGYDIFADDTWAALGTTKLLAAYDLNLDMTPKFDMDAPINSSITSFESMVEKDDQAVNFDLTVGLDSAALGLMSTFAAGSLKFFRILVTGPIIETTIAYKFQLDFAAFILSRGKVAAASNSPAISVPLSCTLAKDPTTSNALVMTLVNTMLSY
ncbi:MAG: hypothetical protein ACR2OO_02080 [Thermomicrobiales bacterium]